MMALADRFGLILDGYEDRVAVRFGRNGVLAGIFVLLILVLIAGYFIHEPWKDESQSWLMARDMSIFELLRNAGTEGHPIGWHLVLKPLIWLGLPFESQRVLNIIFVLAAAALVLSRSPFRIWQRAVIVFTPPFMYFGIYARSYSLILLLCLALASMHEQRHLRPILYGALLGLIANLMVLFIPFAGLLFCWWVWTGRHEAWTVARLLAVGLTFLLFLGACWQLIPPADMAQARASTRFLVFLGAVNWSHFLKIFDFYIAPLFCIIPWYICLFRVSRSIGTIALLSFSFFPFVNMFIYGLSNWHYIAGFVIFIFFTWIIRLNAGRDVVVNKHSSLVIFLFFFLSICTLYESARLFVVDVIFPVSNTQKFLEYAQENLKLKKLAGHEILNVNPVLVTLDQQKIWSPVFHDWVTYVVFNKDYVESYRMPVDVAATIILTDCPVSSPWMLFSKPWANATLHDYSLVHVENATSLMDESYYVYAPKNEM